MFVDMTRYICWVFYWLNAVKRFFASLWPCTLILTERRRSLTIRVLKLQMILIKSGNKRVKELSVKTEYVRTKIRTTIDSELKGTSLHITDKLLQMISRQGHVPIFNSIFEIVDIENKNYSKFLNRPGSKCPLHNATALIMI